MVRTERERAGRDKAGNAVLDLETSVSYFTFHPLYRYLAQLYLRSLGSVQPGMLDFSGGAPPPHPSPLPPKPSFAGIATNKEPADPILGCLESRGRAESYNPTGIDLLINDFFRWNARLNLPTHSHPMPRMSSLADLGVKV